MGKYVQPYVKSPLRYPGGKNRVAKYFLPFIPPHDEYREPFCGGGAMFFQKKLVPKNWLNDLHPGLYAFFKTLRDNYAGFAELCRAQDGHPRQLFDYWSVDRRDLMAKLGDENLCERAVQYYFLNRTVWGGRVVFDPRRKSRLYFSNAAGWNLLEKKLTKLKRVTDKLQNVTITCQGYENCLGDTTPETFIYADPPYYRESTGYVTDRLYDISFDIECHRKLAEMLRASNAKVMVSYDDCPEVRELYPGWRIETLRWAYCGRYAVSHRDKRTGRKERKAIGRELVIMNY